MTRAALPPLALLAVAAMVAVGLVVVAVHGATPPASPHRAQHLEMSRVMPLGAEPSARLVSEASTGASAVAADTKQAEDDYDEFTLPPAGAAATTPASDVGFSIKNAVLKVVMFILVAAKVNTLVLSTWWIIRKIVQASRPATATTAAPSK